MAERKAMNNHPITDETHNPWTQLNSAIVYDNPWISVFHEEVLNPNGNPGIYGKVHFKNLAIGVVPIDEQGMTWLIGQYRYPLSKYSWEIVEGGGKIGVAPEESARRELKEECGLIAGTLQEIGRSYLSNSVSDELAILYLAKNLTQEDAEPDDTEVLAIKKIPLKEAFEWVEQGKILDSMSIIALQKLKLLWLEGQLLLP